MIGNRSVIVLFFIVPNFVSAETVGANTLVVVSDNRGVYREIVQGLQSYASVDAENVPVIVLADAVKRLWPGTPIDAGRQDHSEKYQYDFRFPRAFRPEDFERIEEEMARILAEDLEFERREADREEVARVMTERGEDIKIIRLEDIQVRGTPGDNPSAEPSDE